VVAHKEIPFYNVDGPVGPGCTNKRTDVMLVQFFLHELYLNSKSNLTTRKPPGEDIKINGTCDATTQRWILHFQQQVSQLGAGNVHPDGRVDPARGAQDSRSSITKTIYTINHLSASYRKRFRQEHNHLETHPLIPGELKAELARAEVL
jgi:hypothetical protein